MLAAPSFILCVSLTMLKDSVMVATSRVLSLRKSRYISNCRANVSRDTSMSGTLAPIQHHPSAHSGQIYFTDHTFIELIVIVHSHRDLYTSIRILQRTVVHPQCLHALHPRSSYRPRMSVRRTPACASSILRDECAKDRSARRRCRRAIACEG